MERPDPQNFYSFSSYLKAMVETRRLKKTGLSLRQLARMLKLRSPSQLSFYLTGKVTPPRMVLEKFRLYFSWSDEDFSHMLAICALRNLSRHVTKNELARVVEIMSEIVRCSPPSEESKEILAEPIFAPSELDQ